MKCFLGFALTLMSFFAFANVDCRGIPERVYAGAHGPNGAGGKYWVVFGNWESYLLGDNDNDLAKARFSLAQTSLVSGKAIELSFYSHTSCEQARTDKALPTAMALVR